jgi:hypothetical protein
MRLKASSDVVPTVCPACGYRDNDPEGMVQHWLEAKELDFDGDIVRVPTERPARAVGRPLPQFDLNDLLQRREGVPWWVGLGLIVMACVIPSTRAALKQVVVLGFQVLVWGAVLLLCSLSALALIVALIFR